VQYGGFAQCAEMAHTEALARDGARALPHLNLGLLKLHSERHSEAQEHLQVAVALACGQVGSMWDLCVWTGGGHVCAMCDMWGHVNMCSTCVCHVCARATVSSFSCAILLV